MRVMSPHNLLSHLHTTRCRDGSAAALLLSPPPEALPSSAANSGSGAASWDGARGDSWEEHGSSGYRYRSSGEMRQCGEVSERKQGWEAGGRTAWLSFLERERQAGASWE